MKYFVLFAIILLFSFCDSADKVPREIIQPGPMAEILTDIQLAEGALKAQFILGDSGKKLAPYYYEPVYLKHGVTGEQFRTSLSFYLDHPEKIQPVYDQVLENLNKMESGIEP